MHVTGDHADVVTRREGRGVGQVAGEKLHEREIIMLDRLSLYSTSPYFPSFPPSLSPSLSLSLPLSHPIPSEAREDLSDKGRCYDHQPKDDQDDSDDLVKISITITTDGCPAKLRKSVEK